jgi:hypothetical protein
MAKLRWRYAPFILILTPFIVFYIDTTLYLLYADVGVGVPFYWFGYVTLALPMSLLSVVMYFFVKKKLNNLAPKTTKE